MLAFLFFHLLILFFFFFFFFNDTATTEIYTLSLHDALPIPAKQRREPAYELQHGPSPSPARLCRDRKSTRLNSSHDQISYAVFCLKKKKKKLHYFCLQKKKKKQKYKK